MVHVLSVSDEVTVTCTSVAGTSPTLRTRMGLGGRLSRASREALEIGSRCTSKRVVRGLSDSPRKARLAVLLFRMDTIKLNADTIKLRIAMQNAAITICSKG